MTPTTYHLKCLSRWLRNSTVGFVWAVRLAWRLASGSWYVFHDAPWWMLRMCVGPGCVPDDEFDADIMRWARIESNLRLRRGRLEP